LNISINSVLVLNYFIKNFDFEKYNHNFIKELLTSEISED